MLQKHPVNYPVNNQFQNSNLYILSSFETVTSRFWKLLVNDLPWPCEMTLIVHELSNDRIIEALLIKRTIIEAE